MIQLAGIKKQYGGRVVLDVPALTIQPGSRCALIGPNGSGKSTLLRILAGALTPDEGVLLREDAPLKATGYLPQKPYAFDVSVLENVLLAAGRGGAARQRAMETLERLDLERLSSARGSRLSGGETGRMALARLLVREWKLLLLDEPGAAADLNAQERMEQAVMDYARQTRCTLIFSSHAPGHALRMAQRVIFLQDGRIAEDGPAGQVLGAPESQEAKRFLARWRG